MLDIDDVIEVEPAGPTNPAHTTHGLAIPRTLVLLLAFAAAASLIVAGVALWSVAWALITAGLLLGGLSFLALAETGDA